MWSICRRDRTRTEIGTASNAVKSFELFKNLLRGQPRTAHEVKTSNTRDTHVIVRAPTVIKTWGDAVRRESLAACYGQNTVIDGYYASISRAMAFVCRLNH